MKKVFTTGQVAKICKVAPRTVSKWFDSGRLRGYRIPGSQDRRIPREHLLRFLKEHGMPLGDLEAEVYHKVLVVGRRRSAALVPEGATSARGTTSGSRRRPRASRLASEPRASTPTASSSTWPSAGSKPVRSRRTSARARIIISTILVALTSDEPGEELYSLGFNDAFKKPFDGALLAERVRRLISQKKADEP